MFNSDTFKPEKASVGYDGIMETNGEVIIFNPDKFKITK